MLLRTYNLIINIDICRYHLLCNIMLKLDTSFNQKILKHHRKKYNKNAVVWKCLCLIWWWWYQRLLEASTHITLIWRQICFISTSSRYCDYFFACNIVEFSSYFLCKYRNKIKNFLICWIKMVIFLSKTK